MTTVLSTEVVYFENLPVVGHGEDIFSDEVTRIVVLIVNYSILGNCICVFGAVTNVINIVIFIKNGFTDTVNISLTALAISDLFSVLAMEWISVLKNPLFTGSGIPWSPDEVQYITGGAGHATFARVTSWITAFITFERCLCVVMPLKVKRIITGRVTVMVMVTIYILMILTHLPVYMSLYLGWKLYSPNNVTMLGLLPRISPENAGEGDDISFSLAVVAQIGSFVFVILFTVILVIQMKRKSKWRQEMASGNAETSKHRQKREDRTVKMITFIAVIFIICFSPSIVAYISTLLEPELSITGQYKNAFFMAWSIAFLLESLNSSVNIFVYYSMSTKFRTAFDDLFCRVKDEKKAVTEKKSNG